MKRYRLEDADKWLAVLAVGMKEKAMKGLLSAAERTVQCVVTEIIPAESHMPVDRGIYRAAWKAEATSEGAIVYNDSPYAAVIEDGAKASSVKLSRAMITAIAEWVRRKGIGSRSVTKGSKTRLVKPSVTEATSIAWAIVKGMQANGIFGGKGLGIFAKAEKRIPEFIREEVSRELKKL